MTVYVVNGGRSFLPEALAYVDYLNRSGIAAAIVDEKHASSVVDAELFIRFGGFLRKKICDDVPEIHEYHSATVGAYPRTKNLIKSWFSARPDALVFLNGFVEKQYSFSRSIPRIYRDMGVEKSFLGVRGISQKDYDLVYIGSISARKGLLGVIQEVAGLGIKIAVAGSASDFDSRLLSKTNNVFYYGVLDRSQVLGLISKSRAGLNYCPREYPLQYQTSTKVIEYLVAGIPVVSNDYPWINDHSACSGYSYINLRSVRDANFLKAENSSLTLSVEESSRYLWDTILSDSGFLHLVEGFLNE
tara:strand:+ start:18208 stop:19113 length:906 start_codon:yes stop_codon:yes gene_type:complete